MMWRGILPIFAGQNQTVQAANWVLSFALYLRSLVKKAREVAEAPLMATMTAVEDSGGGAMPDRFPSLVWGLGTASLGGLRYGNHHPGWIDRGETRLTTMTATETASTALDRIQSVTS
jgi:hypothetical protein